MTGHRKRPGPAGLIRRTAERRARCGNSTTETLTIIILDSDIPDIRRFRLTCPHGITTSMAANAPDRIVIDDLVEEHELAERCGCALVLRTRYAMPWVYDDPRFDPELCQFCRDYHFRPVGSCEMDS
jgi:hypothetical protein